MSHALADCFQIEKRGYIREGYFADLVLVEAPSLISPEGGEGSTWTVNKSNILSKCGWSPFEGTTFHSKVTHTFVNGHLAYNNGKFDESKKGQRLTFER